MSANMRGPRVRTPLLLLLLVLIALTGTALCQSEDDDAATEDEAQEGDTETTELPPPDVSDAPPPPDPSPTEEDIEKDVGSGTELTSFGGSSPPDTEITSTMGYTTPEDAEEGLGLIIISVLVVLVVVIIGVIVCGIVISRKWNSKKRNQELRKEDPYLDGSSTEKVPMPMFEEDVPSVLELEMEELDQWMIKDGETAEDSNHA